jgi:hypothetical protein
MVSGSFPAVTASLLRRVFSQRPPIGDANLSEQGGDVALDRTDRDEQPGADLSIGQVRANELEHFRLAD